MAPTSLVQAMDAFERMALALWCIGGIINSPKVFHTFGGEASWVFKLLCQCLHGSGTDFGCSGFGAIG